MYLNEFDATLQQIQGKWKVMILYELNEQDAVRFNELARYIETVSNKTLTSQLRELEHDGLIDRTVFPSVPAKVEYKLTPKGISLIPLLDAICEWGLTQIDRSEIDRLLCDES